MGLLQKIQQGGGLFFHVVTDVLFQFAAVLADDHQVLHNEALSAAAELPL